MAAGVRAALACGGCCPDKARNVRPEIYWVREIEPLRLGIMARPRAGEWLPDEIAGWKSVDVSTVVSLLQPYEVHELGLEDEPTLCAAAEIEFVSFPIPDRGVPAQAQDFLALAERLAVDIRAGSTVAAHCRAGIGL